MTTDDENSKDAPAQLNPEAINKPITRWEAVRLVQQLQLMQWAIANATLAAFDGDGKAFLEAHRKFQDYDSTLEDVMRRLTTDPKSLDT